MIISASRRTDIPAFYSEWFINRIRQEYVLVRNPFNAKQIKRVSLTPQDVAVIVFWTRDPTPLLPYLQELDARNYRYYFQYTITGYPRSIEPAVPPLPTAIAAFRRLSERIGPERVIWRYDPILGAPFIAAAQQRRLFAEIAGSLAGYTRRVIISFATLSAKVRRNLSAALHIPAAALTGEQTQAAALARFMSAAAAAHGISIHSCAAQLDLAPYGIRAGKCIDDELIRTIFALAVNHRKDPGQRAACRCVISCDIGQYHTCVHGCAYCYATASRRQAELNCTRHRADSPILLGSAPSTARDASCHRRAHGAAC